MNTAMRAFALPRVAAAAGLALVAAMWSGTGARAQAGEQQPGQPNPNEPQVALRRGLPGAFEYCRRAVRKR